MRIVSRIISILGAISLAVTLVAAGFLACTLPITTRVFSEQFSNFNQSPYTHDQLVSLACASRDFTVDPYTEGQTKAHAQLARKVVAAAYTSADDKEKAAQWVGVIEALDATKPTDDATFDDIARMQELAKFGVQYALDDDSISHLADVNAVIQTAMPILGGCALVCLACIAILLVTKQKQELGRMLRCAAVGLLIVFALIGVWAIFDFKSFFSLLHAVFFPQGNWTFPYESLLITMYPQAFWMAMGLLWLVVVILGSIMCIAIGSQLKRANGKHVS